MSSTQTVEVRVWDPFVRVFHWLLAAAVLVDWITDEPRWMHVWLGYLAAALVVLRVLWGLAGSEHARFTDFVRGPRQVLGYLAGLIRFSSRRYLGHSPAGGAMVIALLIMVAVTAGTGMVNLAQDEGAGPLAGVISKVERPARIPGQKRPDLLSKEVHETVANITLVLVILHVCGVALASFAHKENLVASMITGRKRV
ncbi:MAG: cytochrome b/b6 domain-containing protein [Rhodomicrobium sp.]